MKSYLTVLAAVSVALTAAAPVVAQSQLIASAGLTADEAQGMTLEQIAAAKANRGLSYADLQAVVIVPGTARDHGQLAASVGLGSDASLNQIMSAKVNRDESYADRQIVRGAGVSFATRSTAVGSARSQLVASAGLTAPQAKGLTLTQIAAAKANSGVSYADRQKVAD